MDQSSNNHSVAIIIDSANINEINKETFVDIKKNYPNVDLKYIQFSRIEQEMRLERLDKFINDNYFSSIYFLEFPKTFYEQLDKKFRDQINKLKEEIQQLEERTKDKIITNTIKEKINDITSIVSDRNTSSDQNTISNLLDQKDECEEKDLIQEIEDLKDYEARYEDTDNSKNYGKFQQLLFDIINRLKCELLEKCYKNQRKLFKAFLHASKVYMETQIKEQQQQQFKNIKIFEI